MSKFNLHTVISTTEELEDDIQKVVAEFHKALAALGHKVESAVLTGDSGQTKLSAVEPPTESEPTAPELPTQTTEPDDPNLTETSSPLSSAPEDPTP